MKTKTSRVTARSWPDLCVVDMAITPGRIHQQHKRVFKSCLRQVIEHCLDPEPPNPQCTAARMTCPWRAAWTCLYFPCLAGTQLSLADREPFCNILPFCYLLFMWCLEVPNSNVITWQKLGLVLKVFLSFLSSTTLFGTSRVVEIEEMAFFINKALFICFHYDNLLIKVKRKL